MIQFQLRKEIIMVYTTKKMQQVIEEIYKEVKNSGEKTGQALIEKKIKELIQEDRERIIVSSRPLIFNYMPFKYHMLVLYKVLFHPQRFLTGLFRLDYLQFLAYVNDEVEHIP